MDAHDSDSRLSNMGHSEALLVALQFLFSRALEGQKRVKQVALKRALRLRDDMLPRLISAREEVFYHYVELVR